MNSLYSVLLIQALHVLLVLADSFNITVIEAGTNGGTVSYRVWYGDGEYPVLSPNIQLAVPCHAGQTDEFDVMYKARRM